MKKQTVITKKDPRFIYQFDLDRLTLHQSGLPCRLELLPARTLAYLLERDGETVTRTELVQRLWPNETYGDFTHRVDKVVHKLRAALRDDAASPSYIETVRGSGFRFIGGKAVERSTFGYPHKANQAGDAKIRTETLDDSGAQALYA